MNAQEAKTKIEALLNLGTLQGVKVVYTKPKSPRVFYLTPDGTLLCDRLYIAPESEFENIQSIEPIPLQPKLLEVGTRVKIIGGKFKDEIGVIMEQPKTGVAQYEVKIYSAHKYIEVYQVVPESLLVEEEKPRTNLDDYLEVQDLLATGLTLDTLKKLEQAGYTVTKKI